MEPEPIPVLGGSETSSAEMATPRATDSSNGRLQSMPTGQRKTPEYIRPYPKAQPRKAASHGRKRGKCMVATSTPKLKRMREKLEDREKKNEENEGKQKRKGKRCLTMQELEDKEERDAKHDRDNSAHEGQ